MEKAVVLTIQTSSSRLQVGVVCPLYFHDTEHSIKVASRRGRYVLSTFDDVPFCLLFCTGSWFLVLINFPCCCRACLAACYGGWVNTCPMTLLFRI